MEIARLIYMLSISADGPWFLVIRQIDLLHWFGGL